MQVAEHLVCELAEFQTASGSRMQSIKGFLTQNIDTYRLPYSSTLQSVVRRCVFVGTVDTEMAYRDPAGSRRFSIVECQGNLDIAGVKRDREQIWAEAYEFYKDNPKFIPVLTGRALEEAREQREAYSDLGVAEDDVRNFLHQRLKMFRQEHGSGSRVIEFSKQQFLDFLGVTETRERGHTWREYRSVFGKFGVGKTKRVYVDGIRTRVNYAYTDKLEELLGIVPLGQETPKEEKDDRETQSKFPF